MFYLGGLLAALGGRRMRREALEARITSVFRPLLLHSTEGDQKIESAARKISEQIMAGEKDEEFVIGILESAVLAELDGSRPRADFVEIIDHVIAKVTGV